MIEEHDWQSEREQITGWCSTLTLLLIWLFSKNNQPPKKTVDPHHFSKPTESIHRNCVMLFIKNLNELLLLLMVQKSDEPVEVGNLYIPPIFTGFYVCRVAQNVLLHQLGPNYWALVSSYFWSWEFHHRAKYLKHLLKSNWIIPSAILCLNRGKTNETTTLEW